MAVITNFWIPMCICKDHGITGDRIKCFYCRMAEHHRNKALTGTPCHCGADSEFFWQSPEDRKEFNATCYEHTPRHMILPKDHPVTHERPR